jgi:hypothetical protein
VIEPIEDLATGVVGMSAMGVVTVDDYETVLEPALAEVLEVHERIRLFLYLGPKFTGFADGAWGELTGEIRHTRFHRGAVVTDDHEIRNALNLLKWMLRGDVRTFQNHEYDKAAHWVAG